MGPAGTNGSAGTNGIDAFTTLTAAFTVPVIGLTAIATVGSTAWMVPGAPVALQNAGIFYVASVTDSTHVVLTNPAAETGNVAAATVIPIASKLAPAGFKGAAGAAGGAGTGVTVATKGDIQTFAGGPANLPVGTDGQIAVADSTAGTGLAWKSIVPNASGTTDNRVAVADTPAGTEKPAALQLIPFKFTNTGAPQNDNGGNARGVDAVDLQPARVAVTQVASGNNSGILSGRNNTASGQGSVVAGETNEASGANAVALGSGAVASGQNSTVAGGSNNFAGQAWDTVAGGQTNVVNSGNGTVAGGNGNQVTGASGFVGGGNSNSVSATTAAVLAGQSNTASGTSSVVGGGGVNVAAGSYSTIPGGLNGYATQYGQLAHAAGRFAANGDAQTSELIWRIATTDATANVEMFLNGSAQRATVPNNTTWAFQIIGVARRDTGVSITFEVKGGIKNDAGTVVLVAAVTAAVIADGTGAALTIANFVVDADDPNNALRIRVTGIAGQNWRWVAHARLVEVAY